VLQFHINRAIHIDIYLLTYSITN